MSINYIVSEQDLNNIFHLAEMALLNGKKLKFERTKKWRDENIPDHPGVYALFEKDALLYIGETGNLRARMSDICRTVNHTFRRKLGQKKFGGDKVKYKYDNETEVLLDLFFDNELYLAYIEVDFGRLEIETHLVGKFQKMLFNSEKKRKVSKINEQLSELE